MFVSLDEARDSGAAYLHVTGEIVPNGTLRYFVKIALIEVGGTVREIVRRRRMTFDQARERTETEAKKQGALYAVMELPLQTLATITMTLPGRSPA